MKFRQFFVSMLKGAAIGTAMIIPGVSGGTLAVLLKIYDKMIDAISNLKKDFKNSVTFLLPIALGAVLAFAAMYYPLKYALQYAPLPTVLLFAGLMAGSCPKLISDARANGFKKRDLAITLIPFAFVIGICFIPGMGEANLGEDMAWHTYIVLFFAAILASCALVVPGISGSMLMMLFGFYEPLLNTISLIRTSPLHSLIVLGIFAIGLVVGFFTIAKLMQYLLRRFPRATYWAIAGFVVGSIPAIMLVFDYSSSPLDGLQIGIGCTLAVLGAVGAFLFTRYADKKFKQEPCEITEENQNG
ncbi:MAG: DUF368 domain-containing protein [Candidatus Coproplasma sp.]